MHKLVTTTSMEREIERHMLNGRTPQGGKGKLKGRAISY